MPLRNHRDNIPLLLKRLDSRHKAETPKDRHYTHGLIGAKLYPHSEEPGETYRQRFFKRYRTAKFRPEEVKSLIELYRPVITPVEAVLLLWICDLGNEVDSIAECFTQEGEPQLFEAAVRAVEERMIDLSANTDLQELEEKSKLILQSSHLDTPFFTRQFLGLAQIQPHILFVVEPFHLPVNEEELRSFIAKAALLANFKPEFIALTDLQSKLQDGVRCAFLADESYYEELVSYVDGGSKRMLFIARFVSGRKVKLAITNNIVRIGIRVGEIASLAQDLTMYHGTDTPRSIGFEGNWASTYGLISLRQSKDFKVEGKYWYAQGTISGYCELRPEESSLILDFTWEQIKPPSNSIGRGGSGGGRFIIPAGHEVFVGYWYRDDDSRAQTWCGVRFSRDITENILKPDGPYSKDFGLHNHDIREIFSWFEKD